VINIYDGLDEKSKLINRVSISDKEIVFVLNKQLKVEKNDLIIK